MLDEAPPSEVSVTEWVKRYVSWVALGSVAVFFVLPHFSFFDPINGYLSGPQKLSEWTLRKLEQLFKDYGYYVVFFGVFLENAMFLGLLVPGSIILILGGLAGQNGSINLGLVIAMAIAATICGDTLSYFVGRMGWTRLLERGSLAAPMAKARESMRSNRRWIILAYHFAGYSRAVGPTAAGLFRIPYRQWAPLDYLGGSAWVLLYVSIGVVLGLFGVQFGDTKKMVNLVEIMFTAIIVGAIVLTWYRSSRSAPAEAIVSVDD